jgi:hypothetical protein
MSQFIKMKNGDLIAKSVFASAKYIEWKHKTPTANVVAVDVIVPASGFPASQHYGVYEFSSKEECEAEIGRIYEELK